MEKQKPCLPEIGKRTISRWSMLRLMGVWSPAATVMGIDHKSRGARLAWGNRILVPKYRETPAESWTALTMQQGAILKSMLRRTILREERPLSLQGCLFGSGSN